MRSLHIRETQLGADHPHTAGSLFGLAALYDSMQRYSEALSLIQRTIQIYEKTLGNDHPRAQRAYSWLQKIEQANDSTR